MFKGNHQKIYFNNRLLATLTQAEATVSLDYEEVELCGQYGTEYEYTGYTIEGTITVKKVDSEVLGIMGEAVQDGTVPEVTITGVNLAVPGTGKTEVVTITNARITEFKLLNSEAKTVAETEIPFNASRYKIVQKVDPDQNREKYTTE